MRRCVKCILPENYPGIVFDEEGICNYCHTYRSRQYFGDQALEEKIRTFQTRTDSGHSYDCILALSGGRDSTYLLFHLVRILGLRVLAYSVDNGFFPEQTRANMESMTGKLGVRLVVEKDMSLERCIRHHLLSFMRKPSAPMIGLLCTGCRLAMGTRIAAFAMRERIPVIVSGSSPIDEGSYKRRLMTYTPNGEQVSFMMGYLIQVAQNPMWVLNLTCVATQAQEFYHHFLSKRRRKDILSIAPFFTYIRWEEAKVVSTIGSELNWQKYPGLESTWRGDCDIALLKLYLYKKMLGYNDKDEGLSYLIRDGQISREVALKRLEMEGDVPDYIVEQVFHKLELNFSRLQKALARS